MGSLDDPNPTVARRELALVLKQARERHRRTLDDLAGFLGVTRSQASRLDSGVRGYQKADVRRLAEWYDFDLAERNRLVELAEEARRRAWWQQVELTDAYRLLIGSEQSADVIEEYGISVIPGLLQTRDYATAAAAVGEFDVPREQSEQAVDIRLRRQGVLDTRAPRLRVVLDESALRRGPRDKQIMLAQLRHLDEMARRPEITVQIIGFEYGLHVGGNSHFILVDTHDQARGLVYSEGLLGEFTSTAPAVIGRYVKTWTELRAVALDPAASLDRISHYLLHLSGSPA